MQQISANQIGRPERLKRRGAIWGRVRRCEALLIEGYGRAYRTAYLIMRDPADAEEAVQEAFLRVWRFRDALPDRRRHPAVALPGAREHLLLAAAARGAPPRRGSAGDELLDHLACERPVPRGRRHRVDGGRRRHRRAGRPARARSACPAVLRYWTGLSEKEIAVAIRRRPGTVKSRLHEARRRLAADPRIAALAPTAVEDAR